MSSIPESRPLSVSVQVHNHCVVRAPETPATRALLLLHGYSETGTRTFRLLERYLPKDALVISPDGVFPIPVKTPKGHRLGHSWYFYDADKDEYAVDMRSGIEYARTVLRTLIPEPLPVTVIGFSQGGYLSPFLAEAEARVKAVIGIGCQFLDEEIRAPAGLVLHAIHGEDDQIVDPALAARLHRGLLARGAHGSFTLVPGSAHLIDEAIGRRVAELLGSEA